MPTESQSPSPPKNTPKHERSLLRVCRRLLHFFRRFDIFRQWRNQLKTIKHYWNVYGGWWALLRSPYLQTACVLTAICIWWWPETKNGYVGNASDIAISVLPNLLGFTVGALAIVLAFSSANIFKTIAESGNPRSFFITLTANLVHFISVQILALICGIMAKMLGLRILDMLALLLLIYAVLVVFSAAIQLFETALIYNMKASLPDEIDRAKEQQER